MPRKPTDDDSESEGSLKDFIVDDSEAEDTSEEASSESEADSSDSGSDAEESEEDAEEHEELLGPSGPTAAGAGAPEVERPNKRRRQDDTDELELMKQEAEKFAAGVSGTVVGGRTLRSRAPEHLESRRPRDEYYEKYGRAEEAKLMEKFTKKDIVEFVARLAPDHRDDYEAAGHKWPSLTTRMTLEDIRAEYEKIKAFLDLPDSDKETSEDEDTDDEEDDDDDTEESESD
jgi:hypothetical protein